MKNLDEFFAFCLEREAVRKAKERGDKKPWTDDPVLRKHFFCNIYREDDRVTKWFRQHIRDPLKDQPTKALMATIAFRWFNSITTAALIHEYLVGEWNSEAVFKVLDARRSEGEALFNGAYIISSPLGDPKLEWALRCTDRTWTQVDSILESCKGGLQSAWSRLCDEQGLGPFMAYEVVTDLRWTCLLSDAPDIMTWANPGPGCARGLGWLLFNYNKNMFNRSKADIATMMSYMKEILACSRNYDFDRPWEMREVEHSLCEYDKWKRGHDGQRLKRRYSGSA